jgi:hypothetical protein
MLRYILPIVGHFIIFFMLAAMTAFGADDHSTWESLTPSQQGILVDGKPVVVEEEVAENAWPRYIVYRLVDCPPAKVAALFWDCEQAPKYVPNCLSVQMVARPTPWIHEAEYTLHMPMMLPEEVYVSRNELTDPAKDVYEISWKVCQARYIKGSEGNLRVSPVGSKALLCYNNLVMPGSSIAGLLQSEARSQVVASVDALARQVEHEICKTPWLMDHQLQKLNESLEKLHPPVQK